MRQKLSRKWLFAVVFTIGILIISYGISTRAYFIATFAAHSRIFITGIFDAVWQNASDAKELRRLRVDSVVLKARVELMKNIQQENDVLRTALSRESEELQFIFARVIARSPSLVDDFLVLDAGSSAGVSTGMIVLVEGAIHIGTIVQTTNNSSTVQLISHANEKIEVVLPESGVSSVAVGRGGGVLEIQVPASIEIHEQESIVSVGPPDFLVGYVEKVEKSDAGPFQLVRTSHPVSLSDLQRVFLVISNKIE